MRGIVVSNYFPHQIGAVVTVVLLLLIYFLVVITCNKRTIFQSFEDFVIFATICFVVGLTAFCYLHYMWVKPSRHLNLSLRQPARAACCKYCPTQLSALEFPPWILTAIIQCVPRSLPHLPLEYMPPNPFVMGHLDL